MKYRKIFITTVFITFIFCEYSYAAIIVVQFSGNIIESNNIDIPVGTIVGGKYTYYAKTAPASINRNGPVQTWLDNALIDFVIWPVMTERFINRNGTIGQYDNASTGDQTYQVMYNLFDSSKHYYFVYFNISGGHFFQDVFRFSDEMYFEPNTKISEVRVIEKEVAFPFVSNNYYSIKIDTIHFDHITPLVPYFLLLDIPGYSLQGKSY